MAQPSKPSRPKSEKFWEDSKGKVVCLVSPNLSRKKTGTPVKKWAQFAFKICSSEKTSTVLRKMASCEFLRDLDEDDLVTVLEAIKEAVDEVDVD